MELRKRKKTIWTGVFVLLILLVSILIVVGSADVIKNRNLFLAKLPMVSDDDEGSGGGDSSPSGSELASCILDANPSLGTGPFDSQVTTVFSNLPPSVNQALVKCKVSDLGIIVPVTNGTATRTCSYPQVGTVTVFVPNATADTASCSDIVTDNPALPPPPPPPSSPPGSGGGSVSYSAPTDPFVIINEGAEETETREVALTLGVSGDATQMMISNLLDFEGADWENFTTIKFWTLTSGSGVKTVYVKFRDNYDNVSEIALDGINLIEVVLESSSSSNFGTTSTPNPIFVFTRNLYLGIKSIDVKILQMFLNDSDFLLAKEGPGSPGKETDFFGPLTKAAVARFQEAYAQKVLAPLNLKNGTGYFGPSTRKFVNSLNLDYFVEGK